MAVVSYSYNLYEAAKHGNYSLCVNNIKPHDDKNDEYLLQACQCTKPEAPFIIRHLLNYGADPNIWFQSNGAGGVKICALFEAVKNPVIVDEQTVSMLLTKCQSLDDQDESKRTLLHYAVKRQKKEFCKELIRKGTRTDIPNCNGRTTYHVSAGTENGLEIFNLLLQSKIEETWLNQPDSFGKTPLHHAVYAGNTEIVKILLEKGSSVNISAGDGATCLHTAVERGFKGMVDMLVENGAEINARMQNGDTPLILAAKLRYSYTINIVKILLENGAELKLTNNKNETAIAVAKKDGLDQVTTAFEESMEICYPICDQDIDTSNLRIAQVPSITFRRISKRLKRKSEATSLARKVLEKCLNMPTEMHQDIIKAFTKSKYKNKKTKWLEVFLKYFWKDYTDDLSKHNKYSLLKISVEETGLMSRLKDDLKNLETYAKESYELPGNENNEKGHWKLAKELGSDWRYVASQLDFKQCHMQQIEAEDRCLVTQAATMLITWQQRTGYRGQEMIKKLESCLRICERMDLAEELRTFYGY